MWSGTRKMRLTNGMAGFQSLPFLTNQKIISVIFWLAINAGIWLDNMDQSENYTNNFLIG